MLTVAMAVREDVDEPIRLGVASPNDCGAANTPLMSMTYGERVTLCEGHSTRALRPYHAPAGRNKRTTVPCIARRAILCREWAHLLNTCRGTSP